MTEIKETDSGASFPLDVVCPLPRRCRSDRAGAARALKAVEDRVSQGPGKGA
jgi:hypothetical protein